MRIATWNVERLKHKKLLKEIELTCEQIRADILILTETDEQLCPSFRSCFQTPNPAEIQPGCYKPTEHRVSIYTNYPWVASAATYDKYTAVCAALQTELGILSVYGTIIGVTGNRCASFREDLTRQVQDFTRLTANGASLCVAGDYNLSFADNYYFTNEGRDTIRRCFAENKITLLTEHMRACVDHIAISNAWLANTDVRIAEWNLDKTMSDHKGIVATIVPR